ncbi:hypothetical protein DPMN_013631 [Dreissena polymorpha]|uniref:Uncharacterized protein n=1 Tax=Dreissena polymorpha TaxID=45954 RepID=A0A9D4NA67_DREPO|nr:hypothetical protein DPMN_013631 [Dreissena polymorpha]
MTFLACNIIFSNAVAGSPRTEAFYSQDPRKYFLGISVKSKALTVSPAVPDSFLCLYINLLSTKVAN